MKAKSLIPNVIVIQEKVVKEQWMYLKNKVKVHIFNGKKAIRCHLNPLNGQCIGGRKIYKPEYHENH